MVTMHVYDAPFSAVMVGHSRLSMVPVMPFSDSVDSMLDWMVLVLIALGLFARTMMTTARCSYNDDEARE